MLLGKDYKPIQISELDREISLLAWGFTLGFGYLTAWKGYKQTSKIPRSRRFKSLYFWLVWLEVVAILGYGGLTWLNLQNYCPPGFMLFFMIFVFWSIQSQTQAQIIINRISVIIVDRRKTNRLRWGVFTLIFILCNISGVLWVGHSLQISEVFARGDMIYMRVEGVIFISVDIFLNFYFIKCVKKQLLDSGLEKYRPLMNFVIRIVFISVGIDLVIVGMMSYHNPRMWLQFHPLGFVVKLNIELSMAKLIAKLARKPNLNPASPPFDSQLSQLSSHHHMHSPTELPIFSAPEMQSAQPVLAKPQQAALTDSESHGGSSRSAAGEGAGGLVVTYDSDERPLQEERDWERMGRRRSQLSCS